MLARLLGSWMTLLSLRSRVRRLLSEPIEDGSSLSELPIQVQSDGKWSVLSDLSMSTHSWCMADSNAPFKLSVCRSCRFPMESGRLFKRFFSTFRIWKNTWRVNITCFIISSLLRFDLERFYLQWRQFSYVIWKGGEFVLMKIQNLWVETLPLLVMWEMRQQNLFM